MRGLATVMAVPISLSRFCSFIGYGTIKDVIVHEPSEPVGLLSGTDTILKNPIRFAAEDYGSF
jgi:hypothetical protein